MLAASLRWSMKTTISPSPGLLVARGSGPARSGAVHCDTNSVGVSIYSLLFLSRSLAEPLERIRYKDLGGWQACDAGPTFASRAPPDGAARAHMRSPPRA